MKYFRRHGWFIGIGVLILFLFRHWFGKNLLSAPDFPFIFPSQYSDFLSHPIAWSNTFNNGFGFPGFDTMALDTYLHVGGGYLLNGLHVSWNIASRILFFWPFLLLGIGSSYYFGSTFIRDERFASISPLVYMVNTYILMLSGGGQMGLMMAYAVAPLVFASYARRNSVLFTIAMALIILFDLRFTILMVMCVVAYTAVAIPRKDWASYLRFIMLPAVLVTGMHAFWLIPALFTKSIMLPEGYGNVDWLKYLSWAEFSRPLSLLHPNWPENIFGKTYFMIPQFLIIPIVVFAGVGIAGVQRKLTREQVFFAGLLLISAFFAKGVNPPFGEVYSWMFAHVPFMNGFRDPTKFYLLVSLAYSVLLPYSFSHLGSIRKSKYTVSSRLIVATIVAGWLLLHGIFVGGGLNGTFKDGTVLPEYRQFAELSSGSAGFSRALIVPWRNRFVYNAENHPAVDASYLFNTSDIQDITMQFAHPLTELLLHRSAVKYVIVPEDTAGEIFLTDRVYDDTIRANVVDALDHVPYLLRRKDYRNLAVYEVTGFEGLTYTQAKDGQLAAIPASRVNSSQYAVRIPKSETSQQIVFSQKFDPRWRAMDASVIVDSTRTGDGFTMFTVAPGSERTIDLYFTPQELIGFWQMVSLISLVVFAAYAISSIAGLPGMKRTICVAGISGVAVLFVCAYGSGISFGRYVWVSPDWHSAGFPAGNPRAIETRLEGGEIRFSVVKSTDAVVSLSGVDPVQGTTVAIDINGRDIHVAPKGEPIDIITLHGPSGGYTVRLRTVCSGAPDCRLMIRDIRAGGGGSIWKGTVPQNKTIAILGDSISGMHGRNGYGFILADLLGWRLMNASVIGSTLTEANGYYPGISRIQILPVKPAPGVVILALGTNDLLRHVPVNIFSVQYNETVLSLKKRYPNSLLLCMGLFQSRLTMPDAARYNTEIESVAHNHDAVYINVSSLVKTGMFQDDVHPGIAAQQDIAQLLATYITGNRK